MYTKKQDVTKQEITLIFYSFSSSFIPSFCKIYDDSKITLETFHKLFANQKKYCIRGKKA